MFNIHKLKGKILIDAVVDAASVDERSYHGFRDNFTKVSSQLKFNIIDYLNKRGYERDVVLTVSLSGLPTVDKNTIK